MSLPSHISWSDSLKFGEEHKLWIFSLCYFLQRPVTSSFLLIHFKVQTLTPVPTWHTHFILCKVKPCVGLHSVYNAEFIWVSFHPSFYVTVKPAFLHIFYFVLTEFLFLMWSSLACPKQFWSISYLLTIFSFCLFFQLPKIHLHITTLVVLPL
jgi:hypothetical protein